MDFTRILLATNAFVNNFRKVCDHVVKERGVISFYHDNSGSRIILYNSPRTVEVKYIITPDISCKNFYEKIFNYKPRDIRYYGCWTILSIYLECKNSGISEYVITKEKEDIVKTGLLYTLQFQPFISQARIFIIKENISPSFEWYLLRNNMPIDNPFYIDEDAFLGYLTKLKDVKSWIDHI